MTLRDIEGGMLQEAFELHQRGILDRAERLYRAVLDRDAEHPAALHLLGSLLLQRGDARAAAELLQRATSVNPGNAAAHSNLAMALLHVGDAQRALEHSERALSLVPAYPEALNNRGNALQTMGRLNEALASYEAAIEIQQDFADAWHNRGRVLERLGREVEALDSYGRALAVHPQHVDALNVRGMLLRKLRRDEEALACFEQALAVRPGSAGMHNNRGNALLALGRDDEAMKSYDRALELDAGLAEAHSNRSMILRRQQRCSEALAACDAALRCDSGMAEAHVNRAQALHDLYRHGEALASYDRAIEIDPRIAEAHDGRGNVLAAQHRYRAALESYDRALALAPSMVAALNNRVATLLRVKRFEEAAETMQRLVRIDPHYPFAAGVHLYARLSACDWTGLDDARRRVVEGVQRGERSTHPFFLLAIDDDPEDQLRCARIFADAQMDTPKAPLSTGERHRTERINVALVSADFHEHATAYLMAELVEIHDREHFRILGVSLERDDGSAMRKRLVDGFDDFLDAGATSDVDVARWIRERDVEIVVDLKGWTDGARPGIFAHRPAPVQVAFLGFPGTTASRSIDYVIADRVVIPDGDERHYSERVVRLPDVYQVNDRKRPVAGQTPTRRELGLPDESFVFCCFNNSWKILPEVFDVWMRVLQRVERSVLWLFEDTPAAARNLRREARRRGIADERLVFAPRKPLPEHLARQRRADLFLDTLPYNAHTTASDALWVGLPVLTCTGGGFASRVATSLAHAAGQPDLVAASLDEYERLAYRLATDARQLAAVRDRLASSRHTCPLFDTDRFRRHIEAAYVTMVERARDGLPPLAFDVPPLAGTPRS